MNAISQLVCKERKSDGGDSKCHQKLKLESKAPRVARKDFPSSDDENCRCKIRICRNGTRRKEDGTSAKLVPRNERQDRPYCQGLFRERREREIQARVLGRDGREDEVKSVRSEGEEKSVVTSKYNCKYKLATAACTLRSTN